MQSTTHDWVGAGAAEAVVEAGVAEAVVEVGTVEAEVVVAHRISFATSATYCSKAQLTMWTTATTQLMSVVWVNNMQLGWLWIQREQMRLNLSLIVNN